MSRWQLLARGAAVSTASMIVMTTDDQVVDVSAWLEDIPDENEITLTISGPVAAQAWPADLYALQTSAQTKTWVRRELREMLRAQTTAATPGARAYWIFSAKGGANETGPTLLKRVDFTIQSTAPAETVVSSRSYPGMGGFPLSRFGSATDWTLGSVTLNGVASEGYALWDGNSATSARIAPSSTGATTTTNYLGTRRVAVVGGDVIVATVSSTSLGITNRAITLTVSSDAAFIDIAPCPARDGSTSPWHQLGKIIISGDAAGNLYWGDRIRCREGTFNPAGVYNIAFNTNMKQPTQRGGGPTVPTAFFGTSASPTWDYADGWNTGWITFECDPVKPLQCFIPRLYFDVINRTGTFLGFRFTGFDMNPTAALEAAHFTFPNQSIRFVDTGGTTRGANGLVVDHCLDCLFASEEAGYSEMHGFFYNVYDQDRCDYRTYGPYPSLAGYNHQRQGNLYLNYTTDIQGQLLMLDKVEGTYAARDDFNAAVDIKMYPGAHSDFYQPNASATTNAPYNAIAAGSYANLASRVGNLCLKRYGLIIGSAAAPIGYHLITLTTASIVGTFQVGEIVRNADSSIRAQITEASFLVNNQTTFPALLVTPADGTLSFPIGITITGETSGATATTVQNSEGPSGRGYITFRSGIPSSATEGMTVDDCQGWFCGENAPAPIAVS
jgi:hypothetical protein